MVDIPDKVVICVQQSVGTRGNRQKIWNDCLLVNRLLDALSLCS